MSVDELIAQGFSAEEAERLAADLAALPEETDPEAAYMARFSD